MMTTTSNKTSRRMATTALSMLPEEMEMDVLLRLPVKSILRFSAVCRRWAALLSSEEFCEARTKLAESTTTEPAAQLLFFPLPPILKRTIEVRSGDGRPLLTLDGVPGCNAIMTTAPCRGLTLLHDRASERYHVFNAATRAAAMLPPCQDGTVYHPSTSSAGLGFDARTKEFKVVRLFSTEFRCTRTRCEVHTLGRGPDSRWRPPTSCADADGVVVPSTLAGAALFATVFHYSPSPVFADGFLHWLVDPNFNIPTSFDNRTPGLRIITEPVLSFSLADETFSSRVRPPPFDRTRDVPGAHLAELDGRLCMVRDLRRRGSSTSSLEIWSYGGAAADGGDDDNWSLEHRIDLAHHAAGHLLTEPQYIRVLGASSGSGNNKVIFVATSKGNVVAYDPVSGTLETILQLGGGTNHRETSFSLFKERLTLLPALDKQRN